MSARHEEGGGVGSGHGVRATEARYAIAQVGSNWRYRGVPAARQRGVIDFNCDMGESFGAYKLGLDEEVIKHVSSVNIAAGFHAGDPNWMARTVWLAEQQGVAIGAHPSYPDLPGFGRRDMTLTPEEVRNVVTYQIGALAAFPAGHRLQHVKPHGAMYNKAVGDEAEASAIVEAIRAYDPSLIHVVLAGSKWEQVARKAGARVAREAYSDRAITPQGTLVPRSQPGAVIHDEELVVRRTVKIAVEGRVVAVDGSEIEFDADTICLHGDTPGAVQLALEIRKELAKAGVKVKPMREIIP
ncbi:MAG: LamB/YcsF family protein [Chloroflexi bacterium]|nr:LamB/YcsF family protein [Chloroflexota bacterium]